MAEILERWTDRVAAGLARVPSAVEARLREIAADVRGQARSLVPVDSGTTRDSIDASLVGGLKGMVSASADGDAVQALEDGGAIRGSPMLAIPIRPDVRAIGSPRHDGDLFALVAGDGRVYLASRDGGALDIRWRLVPSVTVRPQPFLRPAMEEGMRRLPGEVLDAIGRELGVSS